MVAELISVLSLALGEGGFQFEQWKLSYTWRMLESGLDFPMNIVSIFDACTRCSVVERLTAGFA